MDKGIDDLIYIILGVVFVVAQFLRKKKPVQEKVTVAEPVVEKEIEEDPAEFWKHFLGVPTETRADPEPVIEKVPPVEIQSESFRRIDPGDFMPVHPVSSLTDQRPEVVPVFMETAKEPEAEHEDEPFDLRSAVIHSVILERKYV